MTMQRAPSLDARLAMRPYANRMRAAADAFLSNLGREQLARACFAFEDEDERRDWDFIPKYRPRGLPLREMTDRQQVLAQQLLASALSLPGYTQAVSIMAFENVLRELNKERMGLVASEVRHPGKYLFSFFGEPQAEQTWAWRMVGHHVALNFTIVNGTYVAPTPLLFGAEPAQFGVFKPLGDEELPGDHELGFDQYVISDHDREMLKWIRHEARGLPGAAMTSQQVAML